MISIILETTVKEYGIEQRRLYRRERERTELLRKAKDTDISSK